MTEATGLQVGETALKPVRPVGSQDGCLFKSIADAAQLDLYVQDASHGRGPPRSRRLAERPGARGEAGGVNLTWRVQCALPRPRAIWPLTGKVGNPPWVIERKKNLGQRNSSERAAGGTLAKRKVFMKCEKRRCGNSADEEVSRVPRGM